MEVRISIISYAVVEELVGGGEDNLNQVVR